MSLGLATFLGWLADRTRLGERADRGHRRAHHHLPLRAGAGRAGRAGGRHQPAVRARASWSRRPTALERLAEIDTVVFDKTGTLTLGEPVCSTAGAIDQRDVWQRAARLAAGSRHPYARAVVARGRGRGLAVEPAADVREVPGFGLERRRTAWAGAAGLAGLVRRRNADERECDASGIAPPTAARTALQLRGPAAARRGRTSSRALHAAGFAIELLSGDRPRVVEAAARAARHRPLAAPASCRPTRSPASRRSTADGPQGADGRRRPQRCPRAGRRARLAVALHGGRHQPDRRRRRLPGRAAGAGAGDARASPAPHAAWRCRTSPSPSATICVFVPLAVAGLVTPLLAAIAMSASSIAVTANARAAADHAPGGRSR